MAAPEGVQLVRAGYTIKPVALVLSEGQWRSLLTFRYFPNVDNAGQYPTSFKSAVKANHPIAQRTGR